MTIEEVTPRNFVELFSMGLLDQTQNVTILVVSAMLVVRWLEANAGTTEQEIAVPTLEQLSRVSIIRKLDLFKTTCKVLSKVLNLGKTKMTAVMTAWVYERAKRNKSRNVEAYQSLQLDQEPIREPF